MTAEHLFDARLPRVLEGLVAGLRRLGEEQTAAQEGIEVGAWPATTVCRGQVVWDGVSFTGRAGDGQFLACGLPEPAKPRVRNESWREWVGL